MIVFPLSADPLHKGHLAMALWAEKEFGYQVMFDLSPSRYDKEDYSDEKMKKIAAQFKVLGRRYCIKNTISFMHKSQEYNGGYNVIFLVGYDTFTRLIDPKYYYNCPEERDRVLRDFKDRNIRFVVFPRGNKNVETWKETQQDIDPELTTLFQHPEGFVPVDISSTELRNEQ
jgi:nicotinic acid mononucleotide adenylyltransferase